MKLAHGLSIDSLAEPSQGTTAFASWYAPGLSDELGDRLLMFDNSSAPSLELLRFRPSLIATPGFEVALRRRVERLRHFRHPAFAKVRAVEYLGSGNGLALLSNHTPGKRLSEILHDARGPAFAAVLIQQLTPALASLQQYGEGGGHGALAASRIVVTPEGRLMIVEHVLGPALERLQLSADRLRGELGIALPPAASHYRLDSRTDYFQLGLIALSLLLGRRLGPNESREDIARLLEQVARTADRDSPILFASLRGWLERALQVNDQVFESAGDAEDALLELAGAGSVRQALPTSPIPEAALQRPSVTSVAAPDEPAPLVLDVPSDIPSEPLALEPHAEADTVASPTMPADAPEPVTEALEVFLHRDPVEFLTEPIAAELEKPVPTLEFEPVVSVPPAASDAIPDLSPPTPWPVLPQEAEGPSQVSPIDARAAQAHEPPRPMLEELQPRERWRDPAPDSPSQPSPIAPLPTRPRKARLLKTKTKGREEIMRALVSALAMCVVGEAFVIAGLILSRGAGAPAAVLVETAAPGADVLVDGRPAGVTPLQLDIDAATRSIRVVDSRPPALDPNPQADGRAATARPNVGTAGSMPAPPRRSGGIRLISPIDVEVFEGDRRLGSSATGIVSVAAGRHELELVNSRLGYRDRQAVTVRGGQVVPVRVSPPNGRLSINAVPWAEVWIGGKSVGETPLGNLSVPLGEHEIVFRHPQLGEQRLTAVVRLDTVTRVSANLQR